MNGTVECVRGRSPSVARSLWSSVVRKDLNNGSSRLNRLPISLLTNQASPPLDTALLYCRSATSTLLTDTEPHCRVHPTPPPTILSVPAHTAPLHIDHSATSLLTPASTTKRTYVIHVECRSPDRTGSGAPGFPFQRQRTLYGVVERFWGIAVLAGLFFCVQGRVWTAWRGEGGGISLAVENRWKMRVCSGRGC